GHFTFDDICDELCRKLVVRHPHVFGSAQVQNSDDVLRNWDAIKQETKQQTTATETLEGVCKALPALMYAQKLGKRAGRAGMDWENAEDAFRYIRLETDELEAAMQKGSEEEIAEEMGDLLFSCVNTARHLHLDAETTLRAAADKFLRRFAETERLLTADGKVMPELPLSELDEYWAKAKQKLTE
ncbi:MAG: MazG family protein, partial [Oscillospiraceae bacterium]|nr:MazG family protein [Oscillospiraceae bacterium]